MFYLTKIYILGYEFQYNAPAIYMYFFHCSHAEALNTGG